MPPPPPAIPLFDLKAQYASIREELDAALMRVVASQAFVLGPEVEALEEEIADLVGVPHAVGCASGTDALILPLKALGAEPRDEVIVPAFTFFATAGAVRNAGLRPVFCDVDPDTFTLTPETATAVWTDRTRAVVPVHLFGQMANVAALDRIAAERGALMIEDAAQAIGARRTTEGSELRAGGVGAAGAFSFFPTKNLGGYGEGGMITTRDDELARRVRALRVHGAREIDHHEWVHHEWVHHEWVGTNSRLDALQAAVLRVKLGHLEGWTARRRAYACRYHALLADLDEVTLPPVADGSWHVYHHFTIRTPRRDELRAFLAARGIGSGVYYPVPLHLQPAFGELGGRPGDHPVAERLSREVLSLPIFPELGEERVERVAGAIRDFLAG